MSATQIATLSFLLIVAGTAVGMLVGRRLPDHHMESSSKDVVRTAMGMIATMTALVLGLVTASAKSAFDTDDTAVKHTAGSVIALDRYLAAYGPETKAIRDALRATVMQKVDAIWDDSARELKSGVPGASGGERLIGAILELKPATDAQRWYQSRALDASTEVMQTRWFIFNGSGRSVPQLFLIVIVGWLTILFGSFGLFAPRNTTVIVALLVCALSVAGSIFLILEMDDPFGGVMRISDAPMRFALAQMGQ